MGLLNKSFSTENLEVEELIEDRLINNFKQLGISIIEIQKAIAQCKADSKKEGTDNLPLNYGDYLIEQRIDNEKCKIIVENAIIGGGTEDDIRHWWNLSDLERRMIQWQDKMFRLSAFLVFKQEGLSEEDAIMKLRKSYPIYGDPSDGSNTQGDDRPLPLTPEKIDNRETLKNQMSKGFSHYYKQLKTARNLTFKCLRKTYITHLALSLGLNARVITRHSADDVLIKHYLDRKLLIKMAENFEVY